MAIRDEFAGAIGAKEFLSRKEIRHSTDWTDYYRAVPPTAKLTRRYTTRALIKAFARAGIDASNPARVLEIGGANSCFLDRLARTLRPREYHVVDTNAYGLSLLGEGRRGFETDVKLHEKSVIGLTMPEVSDAVFSVGLIEHFDKIGTRMAVQAHFDAVRPGGVVMISFPHPTLLYRATRALLEKLGLWKFPDERPLSREEVLDVIKDHGQVIYEELLWPLVLTQLLFVVRKDAVASDRHPQFRV